MSLVATIPLALTGFNAMDLGLLGLFNEVWDLIIHANLGWRLRWLDRIWVTQEYHHWQHAKDREVHAMHYAGALPLWDTVFGTCYMPKDKRPGDYGIADNMPKTTSASGSTHSADQHQARVALAGQTWTRAGP